MEIAGDIMLPQIKPCPTCGAEVVALLTFAELNPAKAYSVYCGVCRISDDDDAPIGYGPTLASAVQSWDTQVSAQ